MLGTIALYLLLVAGVAGILLYSKPRLLAVVSWIQLLLSGFVFLFTLFGLFRGWYQYQYIFHNSEISLAPIYKLSALWSGDAGSLILWLVIISIILFVVSYKDESYRKATPVLSGFIVMIAGLTLLANPFRLVAPTPADGMGLSMLLQNPWMVTHPPVVFAAYALMAVPFGLTIVFLFKPGPQNIATWRKSVRPWVIASWLLLGLGILLGAIWAYETLGWGGYWGWDPVENSSLIPWLLLTVAVHALIIDDGTNSASRAVAGSILASFCTMMVAVFITRSGALSELSVHTFAGSSWAFWVILAGIVVSVGFSVFVVARAWKMLPNPDQSDVTSKPFSIGIGNIAITVFAFAVLAGTLLPMFGAQSLTRIYYQTILVPVGVIMLLGSAVGPLQAWKVTPPKLLVRNIIVPVLVAAFVVLALPQNGDWLVYLVGACAAFAAASNIMVMMRLPVVKWGAFISHVGLAILACGIIVSSVLQDTSQATMKLNAKSEILGFDTIVTDYRTNDAGDSFDANYQLEYNNEKMLGVLHGKWDVKSQGWIFQPSFHKTFQRDVMVVVSQLRENMLFDMTSAKTVENEHYKLEVVDFGDSSAKIKLSDGKKTYQATTPYNDDNPQFVELSPGFRVLYRGDGTFVVSDFRPDSAGGTLKFTVTVVVRYWMCMLWLGSIILLVGILWALLFRLWKPSKPAPIGAIKVQVAGS